MSTENGPKSVATEGPKNQENPKPWKKRTKIIPRGGPKHQTQDEEETAIRKRRRGRRRKKKKKKKWRITHKIPTAQKVFAKHRSSEDANDVEEEEEEGRKKKRRSKTKFNKHEAFMVLGGLRAHQGSSATSPFFA